MRLRNIPGAKDAIAESIYVIQNPQENKGNWDKVFPQNQPVHLEAKTANLGYVLAKGGAEVRLTGSNPLSTQDDVAAGLADMGVETFGKAGEPFDPNLHNAVMHIEDESLGKNVVAQVFQSGYRRGDRILRHAMVQQAN